MIAILGNEGKIYKEWQKEAEQLGDEKREMGGDGINTAISLYNWMNGLMHYF